MPVRKPTLTTSKPKHHQTILAVDWDGVIHDRANPIEGKTFGAPLPGAISSLKKLKNQGFRIIVHTCVAHTPAGYSAVLEWLEHYKVPYHDLTSVKPVAALYIDDRGLHHTDWSKTLQEIKQRLK